MDADNERQFLRNEAHEFVKIFATIIKNVHAKWTFKKKYF